ncbi:RNA polymerase I-specific transcription initiation factor RRN3 [Fopius arisanus]|uniref:RNA polymerase I-specific transcription initiation factor RRN3 n=1 Tax=Fopius arisanus TaxID=64838 RepID=A0A0C9RYU6_9HYME|nr:PREDICTED: RNA polymerase I-specific transcription initiation factor RRN3 [Fopius arisanus]
MSVVSTRSTSLSSILTTSGHRAKQREKWSRVVFVPPKDLKKTLVNYETGADRKSYDALICMIRDADIGDNDLIDLLNEIRQCISFLGPNHKLLVEVILNISWTTRCEEAAEAYKSFLEDLVCVHIYHCKIVIERLVTEFKPLERSTSRLQATPWENSIPSPEDSTRLTHLHNVLSKILKIVPMSSNLLLQSLTTRFPFFKAPTHNHEVYIHSLLHIISYAPDLRGEILSLIINRLLVIDVNAPRSEIEEYNDENDEDEEVFKIDEAGIEKSRKEEVHPIGHTLDVCMGMILKFVEETCYPGGVLDPEGVKGIYFHLLDVFEKNILPTYASHHVQFIWFYLCSFKRSIVEAFVNWLWGRVSSPNVAPVLRQSAVCYLASLVARGSFVPISLITRVIEEMSTWIHSYISTQDSLECANSDVRIHTVFYAICQALFYVIAFRHKDLVDVKKNLLFLQSLNLTKMVTCKLNPLRMCVPVVVQHFAAVTRTYQLAYCYTVMEHNARSNLPVVETSNRLTAWLDTFFPFDPYVLPNSSSRISPIYLQYRGTLNLDAEEKLEKLEEENDEDDFMDVSFSHSDTKNHLDKFSYSTSPGFIHH